MSPVCRDERGLTLIELLLTVAIMGIAFASILAGVSSMFNDSDLARKSALTETWLRRYAETVDSATYVTCATPSSYSSALTPSPPTGYAVQISTVEYWDGSASATFTTSQSGCVSAGDQGAQRITVQVTNTQTSPVLTRKVVIVKRNPT